MTEKSIKLHPRTKKLGPTEIPAGIAASKILSPRRKTSQADSIEALALEQLDHFGIRVDSEFGQALYRTALHLYGAQADVNELWRVTREIILTLDRKDRVAYFNAKKFLCFQLAKILDTLQNPFRKAYQSLSFSDSTLYAKGPYPVFDNVTAIFSANPVIVRTATYIYACTEWVDDAFHGRELLHEIYSRLLNPTSISLANYIVDLEAGPYASDYLAWNFNSGMAAIDDLLAHLLRQGDIVIASRNIYGGTYQLLHDYYAKDEKFGAKLEWFDGYTEQEFAPFLEETRRKHQQDLDLGRKILIFIESPCNPHGYVLDVPGICRLAHQYDHTVVLDSTIATPFLYKPLQQPNRQDRPDYVVHSYTKDLTGTGNATAGVVIAENHLMFIPKGDTFKGVSWDETLFWSVYYIKGAFLDSEKAFEVISGIKSLALRMLQKCINTIVLARFLNSHPSIEVCSHALKSNGNYAMREQILRYGLPAPLFTINLEQADIPRNAFVRFFDCLSPAFHHQVSLGQSNTLILCPALTSHSELDRKALEEAGISPTTIRIAVGDENPKELIAHFIQAARLIFDPVIPGFSAGFMSADGVDRLMTEVYLEGHRRYIESLSPMEKILESR